MNRLLFFGLLVFQATVINAQRLHELAHKSVVYYSSEEVGGFAQSWAVIQSADGLIYFGNGAGILEYDGTNWRLIQTVNAVRTFSKTIDGKIYAGGDNNIGFIKPNDQGKMFYYSLLDSIPEKQRDFVAILSVFKKDGYVFFIGFKAIYVFKNDIFVKAIRPESDFRYAFQIRNKIFVRQSGKGLMGVNVDTVYNVPGGDFFADKPVYMMSETINGNVIIGTSNNGLFIAPLQNLTEEKKPEFRIKEFSTPANSIIIKNSLYHGIVMHDGNIALATTMGGVIILNPEGKILRIFNKSTGLKIANTSAVFEDNLGNLWVALQNGIARIELSDPTGFFPEETVVPGIINTCISYNNVLYVGTMEGLYELEPNRSFEKDEMLYRVTRINSDYNSVMQLNEINNDLIASTRFNLSKISDKKLIPLSNEEFGFVAYQYKKQKQYLFTSNTNGLFVYENVNGNWKKKGQVEGITYEIRSISETNDGDIWLNSFQGKMPRLHFKDGDVLNPLIKWYGPEKGLPGGASVNVETEFDSLTMLADGKFYRYNGSTDVIESNPLFPDRIDNDSLIYNIYCQYTQNIFYAFTNKGFIRVKIGNETYTEAKIIYPRGIQGQIYFMKADTLNQIIWFSSSAGLNYLDLRYLGKPLKNFGTVIRKIETGKDSVIFDGICTSDLQDPFIVSFEYNALTVNYSSLYFEKQSAVEYSYMLEGLDTSWSKWTSITSVNYPFLPVGTYVFKVKSRNHYNAESNVLAFSIEILPPWYMTWWAYLLYAFIIFIFIVLIFRWYSKRLKKANILLEKTVKARTAEIEKQKNEIELKNVQLQIINKELEKLSIVARETDNAIMIMDATGKFEWVNDGFVRLNQYDLEMLLKERATNIFDISSNPDIKSYFSECIEGKKAVIYESRVKRRDGTIFWAQTTLTPVLNSSGEVSKVVAIDSDITRLKEVQSEVLKQKEEIESTKEELEKINLELEKLSIVATETDNVVMIMDRESNYEWMNDRSLKKMYGITIEELYERKGKNLLASSYTEEIGKIWQKCLREKKSVTYQALAKKATGKEFWTQTTLTPIVDDEGNVVKVIGIDTDISKIKNAEEKIKQQSDELARNFEELQKKNMLISQSIEYAEKIQKAILHNEDQLREIFSDSFVMLMPRDVVSGDFCWFYRQGNVSIIVAADCTGHGVPGAFMSLIGSSILNEIIKENGVTDPARILTQMNDKIIEVLRQNLRGENIQEDGMDVAVCSINKEKDQLTFAGANMPLVLYNEDGIVKVHGDLFSVGGSFSARKNVIFKNQVFNIGMFNGLFLYSDGFQDQFGGEENKKFMADSFAHLLKEVSLLSCAEQKKKLNSVFSEWKAEEKQVDDVLIIGCSFSNIKI